ncbi:DUF3421 domain-containing protein [Legionella worsleiensis]|uniref:Uncharacterized protein n=1 Tax=Legionella worsleiensis TaxID=45076 RepID=A0A0W1AJK3_9GAMM|nr:DUF3421 domain-containing protein [Legionella worsleiensis]KTD81474.1 hypothetical protein Lwor_0512 [Legionella worsleiensis]STY32033.1 Protein of uncharacterised function (DUF3421) [Legionella worsleiensis]
MNNIVLLVLILILSHSSFANSIMLQPNVSPLAAALRTGTDTNGTVLYLCIAKLFDSIQPGKTWAGYNRCNVPYGGKEYIVEQFSIPEQHSFGSFSWERHQLNAIPIGRDTDDKPLYVCHTVFNGSIQPGKTWPGYNHCNISYAGREIITDFFRVLSRPQEIIIKSPVPEGQIGTIHRHY